MSNARSAFTFLLCFSLIGGLGTAGFAEPANKNFVPAHERLTPQEAESLDRIPDADAHFDACALTLPTNETMCEFLERLEKQHPGYLSEQEKIMCRTCSGADKAK